jgi:hypothetical protein
MDHYARARVVVEDAINHDLAGNYEKAIARYTDACELFIAAIR